MFHDIYNWPFHVSLSLSIFPNLVIVVLYSLKIFKKNMKILYFFKHTKHAIRNYVDHPAQ